MVRHSYNSKKGTQSNIHLPVLHVTVVKNKIPQELANTIFFCREVEENYWRNAVSLCHNPFYTCIHRAGALLKLLFKRQSAERWHRNIRSLLRLLPTRYFTIALLFDKLKQHQDQLHCYLKVMSQDLKTEGAVISRQSQCSAIDQKAYCYWAIQKLFHY